MSQEKNRKKTKDNSFVCTDDEVLLLKVTLDYKTAKTMENIDWELCQTKHLVRDTLLGLKVVLVALNTQRFCSPPFWKILRGKRLVLIL